MTDTALIERYLQGDIQAFNTLVWRWEKPIFNFIVRAVRNEDSAKDICQTTFIRVFKQLKRLRDPDKFSPWIYRIALNLCRDEYKKMKNRPLYYLDDMNSDNETLNSVKQMADQTTKNPEELYQNQQVGTILKQALMQLPEEQRVVIIMKQYQELKFIEIADILKESVNTIKSRLYYGLRTLRKILEESKLNKEVLLHEM
jgi:RNA polymerase sigma-70 factor (ECF subfamily)